MSQAEQAESTNNGDNWKNIPPTYADSMSKEYKANVEAQRWNRYAVRSRERQRRLKRGLKRINA